MQAVEFVHEFTLLCTTWAAGPTWGSLPVLRPQSQSQGPQVVEGFAFTLVFSLADWVSTRCEAGILFLLSPWGSFPPFSPGGGGGGDGNVVGGIFGGQSTGVGCLLAAPHPSSHPGCPRGLDPLSDLMGPHGHQGPV